MFGETFDGPVLAGGIPALENDADLEPLSDHMLLEADELDLQIVECLSVFFFLHGCPVLLLWKCLSEDQVPGARGQVPGDATVTCLGA